MDQLEFTLSGNIEEHCVGVFETHWNGKALNFIFSRKLNEKFILTLDFLLFSESNSRFLVEVAPESKDEFEEIMSGSSLACIGQVTNSRFLEIYGMDGNMVVAAPLDELKDAWQRPIRW